MRLHVEGAVNGYAARRKQCSKCPWRKDVNPYDIPNGYDRKKHANLTSTIAKPGAIALEGPLQVMACHESNPRNEKACVGWLDNQLHSGNNILLRIAAFHNPERYRYKLVGEQHACLEDTLPAEVSEIPSATGQRSRPVVHKTKPE